MIVKSKNGGAAIIKQRIDNHLYVWMAGKLLYKATYQDLTGGDKLHGSGRVFQIHNAGA